MLKREHRKIAYVGVRMLELVFIACAILGTMWQGADTLSLSVPQFLMLYGVIGGATCEIGARALKPEEKEEEDDEQ